MVSTEYAVGPASALTASSVAANSPARRAAVRRSFNSGSSISNPAATTPAALIATVVLVVAAGKAPRTDRKRAFALLWGGWLVVTGLVFSYMQGIIHSYYMIALAPAIGALIGAAMAVLWRRRNDGRP